MKHFISSLSVLCANTPPCEGRVSSRKILSLLLILFLSIGNVWGAEVTETIAMKGFAGITSQGYQNVTKTGASDKGTAMVAYAYNGSTGQVRGNKTSTPAGASVTSSDDTKNWSLYNSEAMAGAIKAIKVTQTATGTNKFQNNLYVSLGTSSQGSITAITNAQKQDTGGTTNEINFTIDATKGYTYFKLLSSEQFTSGTVTGVVVTVTYETTGGSEEPVASLTATPTTIDFGTVYEGATVADQTVAVNFANLNGDVTYSVLSTPFSATGNISTTGDNITISADASTIGEYSQTLTVASTTDSKTAEITVKMNVEEKPAPTGTFTLYTGDLIEGDYVIVSTNALKAEVNSDRLASLPVTISGNDIVDPDATIIWHIAKNGDYWTLYNANKNKYAASTGVKNKATLLDNSSNDEALWNVTGTSTYEFINKQNTTNSVNANLRYNKENNENSRWACYSTSTGAALSLYRKAGTQYNVNVSATENGTVTASPTSAEAGTTIALTVTPDAGYVLDALTVTDASSNTIEVADNQFTMPASDVTVTATFKLNEKPAATLTLSKNGVEEPFPGSWKQDDKVTLPSITSDCVKAFVGWSANASCATEPEYAPGASYTLASTSQTLYAVYADGEAGEPTWNRVTNLAALTSGGTFILGYEATPKSGTIIPMRTSGTATTSAAGYMYSGNADGTTSNNATLDMASISESSKFEIVLEASSIVDGAVNIKLGDNYLGNTDTKNNCKLFTSASKNTAFTPTIGTNDVVKLTIKANEEYTTLQFNNNSGSYRYAVYGGAQKDVVFYKKEITSSYSNYSTTCAAAPKAEVNPTSVTATAAAANDKVEVTYENVNTESVAVALFNDEACTDAFSADWLTASLDADKNITYTVAATTLYTERKAYIKLTAPETTSATEPAVVVIPVIQAGKDKVFASLEALLAAITPTTEGVEVTVTLTNEVIQDFYTSGSNTNGIALNVPYEGGVKVIEIYCKDVPAEWVKGGKVSGTITCPWKLYNSTWELCPTAWTELTYTAPATVKSIAVSGTPTKTTYVDGEAFDPTGLVVTATLTDDSTEPIDVALVDWAFNPATLTKGETAVSVTATYNSVSSAAYEVTGLTVNDIPTKTVAEFIAAGGTRCYLEGIVSGLTEGNSMKYGNFDLTDASGTIYVYGCLNAAGESEKFADLGVKNGDKIKVIADEYELYNGTTEEAKNVQYVSHISAATITIADITMEVEEVKTISATVEPAEAVVTYTIKENADNAISLSDNTITALAVGTATITATIVTAADYMGNSVDFTITVSPKSEKVVILAEYNGQWYALKNTEETAGKVLAALPVNYVGGKLYNVVDADKATIEWQLAIDGTIATFKNGENYISGTAGSADMKLATTECEWTYDGSSYMIGNRTFLYRAQANGFKNYNAEANAGTDDYSGLPVVTAPVYETGEVPFEITTTAENGTAKGGGVYKAGEKVTLTADPAMDYTFVSWTKGGEVVSTANPFVFEATENLDLVANFTAISQTSKTLSGKFSTGEYEYAEFATGNLQYNTDNGTWGFAKQQYQYVGEANINVGDPTFTGTIDMFGWSTNDADNNYGVNPNNVNGLYDGTFQDWGDLFSADENWSTLSADQWKYLLNTRANAANLKQIAKVGSVVGIMLFPDAWTMPTDVNVTAEYDNYFEVNIYNYTLEQWEKLEAVGAVFLPAAGRRAGGYGNMINKEQVEETNPENLNNGYYRWQDNTNIYCYYWTSTINESTKDVSYLHNIQALGGDEYTIGTGAVWGEKGRYGQSVRLAKVTDITPVVIRDGLTVGQWGTLCPKQNVDNPTGATFYQIAYLEEKDDLPFNMHFDEVEGNLEAGQPYFFIASATEIKGVKSGEEKNEGSNVNGFYGYIGETSWTLPYQASFDVNNNNTFVIWNNSVFRINAETSIKSERCYIIINSSEPSRMPAPAPVGARRITMGVSGVNGQNTATGMESVDASAQPVKTIINGQLFILRGEKMYDAQGKLVK